jgi:hypothetical protein
MNKILMDLIKQEEEEFNIKYLNFEQDNISPKSSVPVPCEWHKRVEILASGVWSPETYAHLSVCKACKVQYALSTHKSEIKIVAKEAPSALKYATFKLPQPIRIGVTYGTPLLAMGYDVSAASHIPLPLNKGNLCLKIDSDGSCQAWAEPSAPFELLAMKGNSVLSRVFIKPSQPIASFKLLGVEKLQVKFDAFQLEVELEQ